VAQAQTNGIRIGFEFSTPVGATDLASRLAVKGRAAVISIISDISGMSAKGKKTGSRASGLTRAIRNAAIASKKEVNENLQKKIAESPAIRLFLKAQELLKEDPLRMPRALLDPAKTESPKIEAKKTKSSSATSSREPSSPKVEAVDFNEKIKLNENASQPNDKSKKKKNKKSKKRPREEEDVESRKKVKKEKEKKKSVSLSSSDFFMDPATLSKKERRRRKELQRQREKDERAERKEKKRARKEKAKKEALLAETEDPDKEWEVEYVGGLYLEWGQKVVTTSTGEKRQEFYIKDDNNHRVWIKWKDPFADNNTMWSAEVQENLVGIDPERLAKIFRKKRIWPMPSASDSLPNWPERLNKVMLAGYTQWKAPRCLREQDPDEEQTPQFIQGDDVIQSTSKVEESVEESDYETDDDSDED